MNTENQLIRNGKIVLLALVASASILFSACSDDAEPVEPDTNSNTNTLDTAKVSYAIDIKPLLDGSCAFSGCHNTGSAVGSLATYASAKKFAENGRILGSIKHQSGYSKMPKNRTKLAADNIARIEKWITNAYLE